jgi:hypothetical protein
VKIIKIKTCAGSSAVYADSTDDAFIVGLQSFLDITEGNIFINDVMIDTASNSIKASRLHIRTLSITSSTEQANMMVRIRDIVNSSLWVLKSIQKPTHIIICNIVTEFSVNPQKCIKPMTPTIIITTVIVTNSITNGNGINMAVTTNTTVR